MKFEKGDFICIPRRNLIEDESYFLAKITRVLKDGYWIRYSNERNDISMMFGLNHYNNVQLFQLRHISFIVTDTKYRKKYLKEAIKWKLEQLSNLP